MLTHHLITFTKDSVGVRSSATPWNVTAIGSGQYHIASADDLFKLPSHLANRLERHLFNDTEGRANVALWAEMCEPSRPAMAFEKEQVMNDEIEQMPSETPAEQTPAEPTPAEQPEKRVRQAMTAEQRETKNAAARAKRAAAKPPTEENKDMSTKKKAKPAKKAKATKPKAERKVKATKRAKPNGTGQRGAVMKEIARLLQRKNGVTREEMLAVIGWKAVSMQQVSKACGLKLKKERVKGDVTHYFGE